MLVFYEHTEVTKLNSYCALRPLASNTSSSLCRDIQGLSQCGEISRNEAGPESRWHGNKTGGINVARDRMTVDIVVLFDIKAVEETDEDKVQLAIG